MAKGYGVEVWCDDRYTSGRFTAGRMTVALALYRRLITPRGSLWSVDDDNDEEADYGFDLSEYIGAVGYRTAINSLPGRIRSELMKDDRVRDISVEVTTTTGSDGLIDLVIEITAVLQDSDEEFTLTVQADDLTTQLLDVDEAA